jgi:DNA-binding response OmpR family regulator
MSNSTQKKTVYIIEDEEDILSLMSKILRYKDFETIMDFNGNDFDVKKVPCPDLYIIDVNLIGKNGADLCVEIKNECPDIPVVLISANTKLTETALQVKADDHITKPFSMTQLVDLVSILLKKNNVQENV